MQGRESNRNSCIVAGLWAVTKSFIQVCLVLLYREPSHYLVVNFLFYDLIFSYNWEIKEFYSILPACSTVRGDCMQYWTTQQHVRKNKWNGFVVSAFEEMRQNFFSMCWTSPDRICLDTTLITTCLYHFWRSDQSILWQTLNHAAHLEKYCFFSEWDSS